MGGFLDYRSFKKKIWFFLTTEFEFKEDDPPRYIFADKKKKGFVFVTKKIKNNMIIAFAKCLLEKILLVNNSIMNTFFIFYVIFMCFGSSWQ